MKIGIDIRPLQEPYPTGVSEYTHELVRALLAIDRENSYHLFANAWGEVALPSFDYPNVTLHRFRYPNKLLNASMRFAHFPKIERLMGGLDVYFMTDLDFISVGGRLPVVATAHDLSFELYPSFFTAKQRLRSRFIRPKHLLGQAHHILAVSKHTKSDLVEHYGLARERITVTYPGITEQFFTEPSEAAMEIVRARYDLPGNFVLFLGTLGARKNVVSVIEAFELLKKDPRFDDLHLVLAGKVSKNNFTPNSRELVHKRNQVHVLGYVPAEDRPALYRLARAFVYPSYYEGFGFPPLEAMASGTPVIASYASSLGEVIGNAGILIDPYNIEDLRRALEMVLTDQALADDLARRGRERAREFTWEKTARATLRCFQNVCASALTPAFTARE